MSARDPYNPMGLHVISPKSARKSHLMKGNVFSCAGEHIRNWRQRYFILKDNGQFIGFKNKPTHDTDLNDPLNNFTVKNCTIVPSNRPRPFTFYIRGLHMTTVVERVFSVDTEEERYCQVYFLVNKL